MRDIGTRLGMAMGLALVTAISASMPARAAYVETLQGAKIEGSDIRAKSDGSIILTTPEGTRTFPKGTYRKAIADKPAEMDAVAKLIQARQYDEAVNVLENILSTYKNLGWGASASKILAKVHVRQGEYTQAVETLENLFLLDRDAEKDSAIQWQYMEALLGAKQYRKLQGKLDELVARGDRKEAARSQLLRGDMNTARGALEQAALDYLRTVVLFAEVTEYQPEAIYKTAQTLEALRDGRAQEFYKKVATEYPASAYGKKARSELR